MAASALTISIDDGATVSGLWQAPPKAKACLVLAHGAGVGMNHRSMAAIANGLGERGVATLRYQFPYMEKGGRRPGPPAVAHRTVRAAVAEARSRSVGLPLFAGGRSFGARMTSQDQALEPLANVRGLVFASGGQAIGPARGASLRRVAIPMLFLQGSNDALARLDLLQETVTKLQDRATLDLIPDADHAFYVPARTGRMDAVAVSRNFRDVSTSYDDCTFLVDRLAPTSRCGLASE
jgi:uncharacterized protein